MSLTPPKNLSVASLTPINSFSAVSLTPAINFRLFGYFWLVSTTLGKKVFAGVNDTAEKLFTGVNKPAINCLPVSRTPPIKFSGNNKLYWRHRFVFSAKLSPAAEVGHGRRYCHGNSHEKAQRHLTHPDQRPWRPPKLLQTETALFSFGRLRGLWSRYVGCLWMQLFMAVPMTPRRPWRPLNSLSLVLLTPVINIHSRLSLRIFEKILNGPNGIPGGLGDTDSWKNLKSKISCQTPFKLFFIWKKGVEGWSKEQLTLLCSEAKG